MKTRTLIAGVLLATSGAAWAQGPTTVVGEAPNLERVAYQPADLASERGVSDLRSRVRRAAHRVCDLGSYSHTADYRERICYTATLPAALAQVDRAVTQWARGEAPSEPRIVVAAR